MGLVMINMMKTASVLCIDIFNRSY